MQEECKYIEIFSIDATQRLIEGAPFQKDHSFYFRFLVCMQLHNWDKMLKYLLIRNHETFPIHQQFKNRESISGDKIDQFFY